MISKSELNKYIDEQNTEILEGKDFLSVTCDAITDMKEGEEIAAKLFRVLSYNKTGVGLSANQIGINKRVCVLTVKEPIYLINPTYTADLSSHNIIYLEQCLSFPNQMVRTERFGSITVKADNIEGELYFDVQDVPADKWMTDIDVLECVAIQHEIDHINGLEMFDREYKPLPISVPKTYDRNDKVTIYNFKDPEQVQVIKFKRISDYVGWGLLDKKPELDEITAQLNKFASIEIASK